MADKFLGRSIVVRELMPQDVKLEIDHPYSRDVSPRLSLMARRWNLGSISTTGMSCLTSIYEIQCRSRTIRGRSISPGIGPRQFQLRIGRSAV
jgi:hypothetical protein